MSAQVIFSSSRRSIRRARRSAAFVTAASVTVAALLPVWVGCGSEAPPAEWEGPASSTSPVGVGTGPGIDPNGSTLAPSSGVPSPSSGPTPTASTGQPPAVVPPPSSVEVTVGVRSPLAVRISKSEYAWSVWDVLGVELSEQDMSVDNGGLPDDAGDGVFKRFADKQVTIEQHAAGLWALADLVANRVSVDTLRTEYGACAQATIECVEPVLLGVGERLFRRPLEAREVETYVKVSEAAIDAGESFEDVTRWTLRGLLQAPAFVFQLQQETQGTAGMPRTLNPFEAAARLASFIWSSVPDAELLAAAKDGTLTEPAVYDAQIRRMLGDTKAQRMTEAFIRDYSRAERASFLDATDADREALRESIVATFQSLVWEEKRPLGDLFTTTDYVVNQRTAELLGLEEAGPGLSHVDVSDLPERVGLLTHPGVIAGMGDQEIGSFVNRGKFLMERLLCLHPAAVPATLAAALEEFTADTTGLTEHERMALRKTRPECWGCHAQFEPFALGFARFDGAGRYRGEVDAEGKPLPLDGWIPVSTETASPHYSNVQEYMNVLRTEPAIQTCLTEHFLSYGTSYAPDALTRKAAATLASEGAAAEQTLVQMVDAVVHSDLFGQIIVQPTTTEGGI